MDSGSYLWAYLKVKLVSADAAEDVLELNQNSHQPYLLTNFYEIGRGGKKLTFSFYWTFQ